MNIGHITYRYKPMVGGAETYLGSLYRVLENAGHSQRVYQIDTGVQSPELRPVRRLPRPVSNLVGFNVALLERMGELRQEDVLIVHYPEHFAPVSWHRNVIVLSHGATWTHEKNLLRRQMRLRSAMLAYKFAKVFVANDTFVLRELGLSIEPKTHLFEEICSGTWFIPNAVDTEMFRPNEGLSSIKRLNALLVPRNLTYSRGTDIAIEAFAMLKDQRPDLTLLIAGDAIKDYRPSIEFRERLMCMVREHGLTGRVLFLGGADWHTMPQLYASALMTLIPTRFSEGTSLSALESMACGTPTIGTCREGLLDLPLIFCNPEPHDLADKVTSVLNHATEIGAEQRRQVLRVYNHDNWATAWIAIIERLRRH